MQKAMFSEVCRGNIIALVIAGGIALLVAGCPRDPADDDAGDDDAGDDDDDDAGDDDLADDDSQDDDDDTADTPSDPFECDEPQPGWVFCTDFEEGEAANAALWDDYDGNPTDTNLLMPDDGPFDLEENHVMRLRVPPGRGGADLVKVLPDSYDSLYARWYVQWEPGYDFDAPNHGGGLHAGDRNNLGRSDFQPDGDDWFCSWLEPMTDPHVINAYTYYRGMYMDCADPDGSCWGDHFPCMIDEGEVYCEQPQHRETVMPPELETGTWYCLEMQLDGGTPSATQEAADGRLNWWIDDVEIGPWDDLWLRTTADLQITILWLSLFHHEEHSVEGLMLDHVVVSTERIGCLGRGE